MGGTCYGIRATLLVTDEKALYTRSTWGQAVGAGGQSWVSSALYCSVRPAEETSDVAYYRTTHVARSILRTSVVGSGCVLQHRLIS